MGIKEKWKYGCKKFICTNPEWKEEKNEIYCGSNVYGVLWLCPECLEKYKNKFIYTKDELEK